MRLALLVVLAAWVTGATAFAETLAEKDTLALAEIKRLSLNDGSLSFAYILPCDAQPLGVFAQPVAKGTQLRLAVVVKRKGIQCAAMPQPVTGQISLLKYKGLKKIVKMNPKRIEGKLRLGRIAGLQKVGKGNQVEAVLQKSCLTYQGFVIRQQDHDTLGVGFLESYQSENLSKCRAGERVFKPKFLAHEKIKHTFRIESRLPLEAAFHLRLAPISPGSIQASTKSGEVSLKYQRRCNEAPVGMVVGKQSGQKVPVGMLVAHYFNRSCSDVELQPTLTEYAANVGNIRPGFHYAAMQESKDFGAYTMRTPTQMGFLQGKMTVRFLGNCGREVGMVYATDIAGQTTIGVLRNEHRNSECKSPTTRLSFQQPFIGRSSNKRQNYPLRVVGTTVL